MKTVILVAASACLPRALRTWGIGCHGWGDRRAYRPI